MHIYKDTNELSIAVAEWMTTYIRETLEKKDRFTIALSGGSTPQKLHEILVRSPYREKIDWAKLHVFWGDERAVPFDDERNNARMAYDTLLHHVPIPPHQIHIMKTDVDPEDAALEYEKILHLYFDETPTSFDLVLLGMGDDGHTLSLFPGTDVVHEHNAWAKAFYLETQQMHRITLTAPIVNRSAAIVFLVAGSNKSAALKQVLKGTYQPDKYPSQQICPQNGELYWFVDEAAALEVQGSGFGM